VALNENLDQIGDAAVIFFGSDLQRLFKGGIDSQVKGCGFLVGHGNDLERYLRYIVTQMTTYAWDCRERPISPIKKSYPFDLKDYLQTKRIR
jgi:hypothetical protein